MKANNHIYVFILACLVFAWASILIADGEKSGEQINWEVISNGGTDASSTNYRLEGTASQAAVGESFSDNYRLKHGFWQIFNSSTLPCQGRCGNVNGDEDVNISDAVYIINYVFIFGSPEPLPVLACADVNSDADVNVSDAVYAINFVFVFGSPAPGDCSPGLWPGGDCCPF